MATTKSAAIAIEKAHTEALEVVREYGTPETAEYVSHLDSLGIGFTSVKYPVMLASAQSVLIGALAKIVEYQGRRIEKLEEAASERPIPAADKQKGASRKGAGKKG